MCVDATELEHVTGETAIGRVINGELPSLTILRAVTHSLPEGDLRCFSRRVLFRKPLSEITFSISEIAPLPLMQNSDQNIIFPDVEIRGDENVVISSVVCRRTRNKVMPGSRNLLWHQREL